MSTNPKSFLQEKLSPDEWERFQAWADTLTFTQYAEALGYAMGYVDKQSAGEAMLPDDLTEMLKITKHQKLQ